MVTCSRGCVIARQHGPDCDDEQCRGCKPREAQHGLLCNGCHARLVDMLDNAPKQRLHLEDSVTHPVAPDYSAITTAKIGSGWRMSSTAPHQGPHARPTMAGSEGGEPIRLDVLAMIQELDDTLSQWVEDVCERSDLSGPPRLLPAAGPRHGRWQVSEYGDSYVWREPSTRYDVESASRWLVAQVARLEALDYVGDLVEELADVMARAHCLAPWREQIARLSGIECPQCHAHALVRYGGDDFVTCQRCSQHIDHKRYAIWVRILTDEHRGRTTTEQTPGVVDMREAAEHIGVTPFTIRGWVAREQLAPLVPNAKPTLFRLTDVIECALSRMPETRHARLDALWREVVAQEVA